MKNLNSGEKLLADKYSNYTIRDIVLILDSYEKMKSKVELIPDLIKSLDLAVIEYDDCINHSNPKEMENLRKMKEALKKAKRATF